MVIITGTSSGIGKALALFYLQKKIEVIGISRKNDIDHENFTFIPTDLSDFNALKKLDLKTVLKNKSNIILINNAGAIGSIKRTHELCLNDYYNVSMVNIVALQYLCSEVLRIASHQSVEAIVNISSGAGRRAIPSWSAYCASKAAVDLFSETMAEEFKEIDAKTKIYSVAPGVVDTNMQVAIRKSNSTDFSSHQKFIDLKQNNELRSPEKVAELLDKLLSSPKQLDVIYRL